MIRTITVVTPSSTFDLTVLATVKEELGIANNTSDSMLARWISDESARIATYLNRTLAEEEVVEVFSLTARDHRAVIVLNRSPVGAISAVTEDGAVLETADYHVDMPAGIIRRRCGDGFAAWSTGEIEVSYTGGYVLLDTLPRPIEVACIELVKRRWHARGRDPQMKSLEIPGVVTEQYWVGAVDDTAAIPAELDRYRRIAL